MRCLKKNKRIVQYKTYTGKTQVVQDGYKTGEYVATYSSLKSITANVSAARGVSDLDMFGIASNYSRVMVTCDMSCDIDEKSIVWIDAPTSGQHDYVVVQVAKSLNSISYALLEVPRNG